jgi:hypothetical protein
MITTLISFLGGSVFRMIWGEASAWLTKRQDHSQELDRMRLQAEFDAAAHARNIETIKVQADAGVRVIQQQAAAHVQGTEADAWLDAVKGTSRNTGIKLIDAWNGVIRPFVATWAVAMITIHYAHNGWVLDENGWGLCGVALGIYLADRALFKRGK